MPPQDPYAEFRGAAQQAQPAQPMQQAQPAQQAQDPYAEFRQGTQAAAPTPAKQPPTSAKDIRRFALKGAINTLPGMDMPAGPVTAGNLIRGRWQGAKEELTGMGQEAAGMVGSLLPHSWSDYAQDMILPGFRQDKAAVQSHVQSYQAAKQSAQQGDVPGAVLQSVATGVPLVGPMATNIYQKASTAKTPAQANQAEGAAGADVAALTLPEAAGPVLAGAKGLVKAADPVAAMRSALPGSSLLDASIDHLWGTANEMGLKPADFAKSNPQAAANLAKVVDTAQTKLQQNDAALAQPIVQVPQQMPSLIEGVRNKFAQAFDNANPELAAHIRSGQGTVGDLLTIRNELNRVFDEGVYSSPEKTALQQWGKQVRSQLYDEIAKFHQLPDEAVRTMKQIQGNFLEAKTALGRAVSRLQLQSDVAAGSTVGRRIGAKVGGAADLATAPIRASLKAKMGVPGLAERLEVGMRGMKDTKPYSVPVSNALPNVWNGPTGPSAPTAEPQLPWAGGTPPVSTGGAPIGRPGLPAPQGEFPGMQTPAAAPARVPLRPEFPVQRPAAPVAGLGGEQPIPGRSKLPTATPAAPELLAPSEPALGKPAAGPAKGGAPTYTPSGFPKPATQQGITLGAGTPNDLYGSKLGAITHDIMENGKKLGEVNISIEGRHAEVNWVGGGMESGVNLTNKLGVREMLKLRNQLKERYGVDTVGGLRPGKGGADMTATRQAVRK